MMRVRLLRGLRVVLQVHGPVFRSQLTASLARVGVMLLRQARSQRHSRLHRIHRMPVRVQQNVQTQLRISIRSPSLSVQLQLVVAGPVSVLLIWQTSTHISLSPSCLRIPQVSPRELTNQWQVLILRSS